MGSSSVTITTTTTHNGTKQQRSITGGGVADYFAILGIGDSITFKVPHKNNNGIQADNEDDKKLAQEKYLEEEECVLVERFYREIVDLALITVEDVVLESLDSKIDERNCSFGLEDEYEVPDPYSNVDNRGINKLNLASSFLLRKTTSTISTQPSGMQNMSQHDYKRQQQTRNTVMVIQGAGVTLKSHFLPKEVAGYHMVWNTLPLDTNSQKFLSDHVRDADDSYSNSVPPKLKALQLDDGISSEMITMYPFSPKKSRSKLSDDLSRDGGSYQRNSDGTMSRSYTYHDVDTSTSREYESSMDKSGDSLNLRGISLKKGETLDSDLNPTTGFRSSLLTKTNGHSNQNKTVSMGQDLSFHDPTPRIQNHSMGMKPKSGLGGLVDRIKSKNPISPTSGKQSTGHEYPKRRNKKYYVGFRRRGADENDRPAIADSILLYVRVHISTIPEGTYGSDDLSVNNDERSGIAYSNRVEQTSATTSSATNSPMSSIYKPATNLKRSLIHGAGIAARVALSGASRILGSPTNQGEVCNTIEAAEHFTFSSDNGSEARAPVRSFDSGDKANMVPLLDMLTLPEGFDEWVIPDAIEVLALPTMTKGGTASRTNPRANSSELSPRSVGSGNELSRKRKTFLVQHVTSPNANEGGFGIEAYIDGGIYSQPSPTICSSHSPERMRLPSIDPHLQNELQNSFTADAMENEAILPVMLTYDNLQELNHSSSNGNYEYFPIIAVRRQQCGNDERFNEDSAVTDLSVSFVDPLGNPVFPEDIDEDDDDEDENDDCFREYLKMTKWSAAIIPFRSYAFQDITRNIVIPIIVVRKNVPMGFADVPIVTGVLDRFPRKDYKGLPLPTEELPMFCYPRGGCHLLRAKGIDCPQPLTYGFVVKNERGDSIFVSCISFMEPLSKCKLDALDRISERRRKTSVAHFLWDKEKNKDGNNCKHTSSTWDGSNFIDSIYTGFDQTVTFECKTICLTSRYPFWTAFRRFLAHLHLLSASSSELPVERYISHLLLTVPIPKPGGQCILLPLPALSGPMVLTMPPTKDLPLLDLSFKTLFSCLDVPTVVTIVLALLALERKAILISIYPSLVLDVCELLRSLLFPFELCAPYVPRLTQPFMGCLNFPGSIFVGIHDDGTSDGLASAVRRNIPEDTLIVDLDTGDIDCAGNRFNVLSTCWEIIPSEQRTLLVSELEILCRDSGIIPGQEALGQELETSFEATVPRILNEDHDETIDDRAIRDCFLRFFCSILGGYERFLVVPDMDYLISGSDWFDSDGFISTTVLSSKAYLKSLVATQMFQAFIQRRTESSDIRCLLFDECISEFHSSKASYGRLSKEVTYTSSYGVKIPVYNLLIDQCAAEPSELTVQESDDGSSAEMSFLTSYTEDFMINNTGDLVTAPSRKNLQSGLRYLYCVDGNSSFPQKLDSSLFYPKEPDRLCADIGQTHVPILTRSERELDESKRRRRHATSSRSSGQKQRRCLLQYPKLMGSHFLCTWLMCVPHQLVQPNLTDEQQINYLLRALGAVRLLRTQKRIIPDECGYRSLIVACGRSCSDRRLEVVKLFGFLRSDGNFPSAVTLGQYTRAIAEGFSKRSSGKSGNQMTEALSTMLSDASNETEVNALIEKNRRNIINILDGNLVELEQSGRSWRYERDGFKDGPDVSMETNDSKQDLIPNGTIKANKSYYTKRGHHKSWFPVTCSSSFNPLWDAVIQGESQEFLNEFKFIALWSRATTCERCSYVLLDEEIQGGWQTQDDDTEPIDTVGCPRCFNRVYPLLGYKEMTIDSRTKELQDMPLRDEEGPMPPQLKNTVNSHQDPDSSIGFVPYTSPSKLRYKLEKYVEEYGEDVLERERLRRLDPTIFYNFWWYCARFSLPLPLAIEPSVVSIEGNDAEKPGCCHWCAIASWDKSVAEEGCRSAALCILQLFEKTNAISVQANSAKATANLGLLQSDSSLLSDLLISDDFPILANFNLQSYAQSDWDHPDLSEILFKLVEACDKRDLLPVIECILQRNLDRAERYGPCDKDSSSLDCYKTLLYLTRYQCTSAFHRFFPAVSRPCRGWHFWCPTGTVSIFDRMFRDAVDRLRLNGRLHTKIHEPSDQALGFRSVFGQLV